MLGAFGESLVNDLLLRALRGQPTERVPIWIMRQAGRYLPEYRALRERVGFETLLRTPELAIQATLQPVDRLGVDAAILFSDILVTAEPMGFQVAFSPGPIIDNPVRTRADVDRVRAGDPAEALGYVYEAIRGVRGELEGRVPLIGFAAAPFTLAAYLVEGRGPKELDHVRGMIYADPSGLHRLLETITGVTWRHVAAQVQAGAQAIQLFDSWAGVLSPAAYREFALPYARRVLEELRGSGAPRIYFALHGAHLLEAIGECGADAVGVDWRVGLDEASRRLGHRFVLQGNLDPCALLGPPSVIVERAREVLECGAEAPGHVFNLGHGILPSTPVEHAQLLVDAVRGARAGAAGA
jgi:uroporphyrinogen decarboxylase